jgi:phospholipase C
MTPPSVRSALGAAALLGGLVAVLWACGGGAGGGSGPPAQGITAPPTSSPGRPTPTPTAVATSTGGPLGPISHVLILVQENRSFDNLFSGFPGADSATSGRTHTGQIVPLRAWPFEALGNLDHERDGFLVELNGGLMNGFDLERIIGFGLPPNFAYAYVPHSDPSSEAGPYWVLAQRYTLADHLFQSNSSSSYAAHQFLIAAQSGGVIGAPDGTPWGCDAPEGTITGIGPDGNQPGPFPCFSYESLATPLDAAGVSWKYYAPNVYGPDVGGLLWSAFDAVRPVRYGPDWHNVSSPETNVLRDIAGGTLPSVSWVIPSFFDSDHPNSLSASGPSWIGAVVNGIGNSRYWNSTAIFVLWDDWGGWYDNVRPPVHPSDLMGPGFRVPMIVVSPYAKHNYVSHVEYEFGSILRFVESTFSLTSLGKEDAGANPLSDCFDFSQKPAPYVPLSVRRRPQEFLAASHDRRPPDER